MTEQLTKREQAAIAFGAAYLQGAIVNGKPNPSFDKVAYEAWQYADALLEHKLAKVEKK